MVLVLWLAKTIIFWLTSYITIDHMEGIEVLLRGCVCIMISAHINFLILKIIEKSCFFFYLFVFGVQNCAEYNIIIVIAASCWFKNDSFRDTKRFCMALWALFECTKINLTPVNNNCGKQTYIIITLCTQNEHEKDIGNYVIFWGNQFF